MPDAIDDRMEDGSFRLLVPRVGENVEDADVSEVLVVEGAIVKAGDELIVLETDKTSVSVSSPHSGRITSLLLQSGDVVRPRDLICELAEEVGTS